jgi:hypothetical protein
MTIRNHNGEHIAECDECGSEVYGGTTEFLDFIQELKNDGWRIRKVEGEWEHYCEACSED